MFTVVIDESGDVGLDGVKPDPSYGPTQYFCICATIFRDENRGAIEERLRRLEFGSSPPHANKLSHFQKAYFCRAISELPVGMIGVISNKLSLLDYLPQASKTPTHFYNKVMQYLFERLGASFEAMGIQKDKIQIHLEAREQQYSSLLALVDAIQRNPLDARSLAVRRIDRFSISPVKKKDDFTMALSDMGANALFSAVRRDSRAYGLSETRYLRELCPIFLSDKNGRISPMGIKPIHSLDDLQLSADSLEFFKTLKNPKKEYHLLK